MINRHRSCCERTSFYASIGWANDIQRSQEELFGNQPPKRQIVFPGEVEIHITAGEEALIFDKTTSKQLLGKSLVRGIAFLPPNNLYVITDWCLAKRETGWKVLLVKNPKMKDRFTDIVACRETQTIYVLSAYQLIRSDDNGETWSELHLPLVGKMRKIRVALNRMAICYSDGSVCFSEDGGQTWHLLLLDRVADLCIPRDDPDLFFVLRLCGEVLIAKRGFHPRAPVVMSARGFPPSRVIFLDDEFLYAANRQIVGRNLKGDNPNQIGIWSAFPIKWAQRCQKGCFLVGRADGIYLLKDNKLSQHPVWALNKAVPEETVVECYNSSCYVGGPWPYLLETHNWGSQWLVIHLDDFLF